MKSSGIEIVGNILPRKRKLRSIEKTEEDIVAAAMTRLANIG